MPILKSGVGQDAERLPRSPYVAAALYEKGRAYTQLTKYSDASTAFQRIIPIIKHHRYYPKALVEMGLIQVNQNNPKRAWSIISS